MRHFPKAVLNSIDVWFNMIYLYSVLWENLVVAITISSKPEVLIFYCSKKMQLRISITREICHKGMDCFLRRVLYLNPWINACCVYIDDLKRYQSFKIHFMNLFNIEVKGWFRICSATDSYILIEKLPTLISMLYGINSMSKNLLPFG